MYEQPRACEPLESAPTRRGRDGGATKIKKSDKFIYLRF